MASVAGDLAASRWALRPVLETDRRTPAGVLDRELPSRDVAELLLPLGERSRLFSLFSDSGVGRGLTVVRTTVPPATVEEITGAMSSGTAEVGCEGAAGAARAIACAGAPSEDSALPNVAVESVDICLFLRLITCR